MSREEQQLDAAEYVIGTLSAMERKTFEEVAATDENVRADLSFWERVLGALNVSVAPVIPGNHVWERIDAATRDGASGSPSQASGQSPSQTSDPAPSPIDVVADEIKMSAAVASIGAAAETPLEVPAEPVSEAPEPSVTLRAVDVNRVLIANDNLDRMRSSRSRWRWGAIAAGIAALAFGATTFNAPLRDNLMAKYLPGSVVEAGKEYIAVVNANADQPALIVKVNAVTGEVTVRSLGMDRPDGKSLELWYVPEGQKAVSVGLVGEGGIDLGGIPAKQGDLLAISLEPQGGSPTGTATGPVIYTGKLIEDIDAGAAQ